MRRHTTRKAEDEVLLHEKLVRPPSKTFRRKLRDFFWDTQNKTCMTRSPVNWLSITVYYFIFLFAVLLVLVVYLIGTNKLNPNPRKPLYVLDDSPLGSTPSLNFFPMHKADPLIWITPTNYQYYINIIKDKFAANVQKNSTFDPTKQFGECGSPPFGYANKTPCLFFQMNRLIDWKPDPYTKNDTLPSEIPEAVKALIKSSSSARIWMSCAGSTAKDRDHINETFFEFQGERGFDISPYPFESQKDFVDPIVALKYNDPLNRNRMLSFTCYAWGKKLNKNKTAVDVLYYYE